MKKFLVTFMLAASALTMVVADADAARRLGGGGSFGRQSPNVTRQAPPAAQPGQPAQNQMANPNQARPGAPAATPQTAPRPASPWRNILGGALLGLGLGALLSHLGIGGALASVISTILMIALLALAAMFIYRMIRRRTGHSPARPAYAGGYSQGGTPDIGSRLEPHARPAAQPAAFTAEPQASGGAAANQPWGVPADFDVDSFLRSAKTYFIRLQAAWDRGDIKDIREFTTPEMFAELKKQLEERGAAPSHTDVVSMDAELLGIERVGDEYLASVKFSGLIKEAENAPAEPFTEVWNLVKPVSGQGGWVLAGIQQLSQA